MNFPVFDLHCDTALALLGKELGDELLISASCLRHGEDVFLCGMTKQELSMTLGVPVRAVGADGFDFLDAIFGRE